MNYSVLTYKSSTNVPKIELQNSNIVVSLMSRFDIKNVKGILRNSTWIGYVIKMTDYAMTKGKERRKNMIFPFDTTYSNRDEYYKKFGKLFAKEPLSSIYPQTNDPLVSYIYGCVEN